jgi:hypothetical protein
MRNHQNAKMNIQEEQNSKSEEPKDTKSSNTHIPVGLLKKELKVLGDPKLLRVE